MLAGQEFFFEDFGKRMVYQLAVEHFFDFRIAARERIANNHEVGGWRSSRI